MNGRLSRCGPGMDLLPVQGASGYGHKWSRKVEAGKNNVWLMRIQQNIIYQRKFMWNHCYFIVFDVMLYFPHNEITIPSRQWEWLVSHKAVCLCNALFCLVCGHMCTLCSVNLTAYIYSYFYLIILVFEDDIKKVIVTF